MSATDGFPAPWRATWIWAGPPALDFSDVTRPDLAAGDTVVLLRRVVHLDRVPSSAPARVTADSRYVLLVNGVEIARGPIRDDPRRLHHDRVDLAAGLRTGENVLAVVARFYGRANSWWMPAPPTYSLGAGAVLFEARLAGAGRGDDDLLVSDRSWRALRSDAWTPSHHDGVGATPVERVDARLLPVGWELPGFDDTGWPAAHEIVPVHLGTDGRPGPPNPPYGAVLANPLPGPVGERRRAHLTAHTRVAGALREDDPVEQVLADEASAHDDLGEVELLTFDFGGIVSGILELEIDAPEGTQVDLAAAESLHADGRLCLLDQHAGLRYTARGGDETYRALEPIGTRYLRVAVRGEGPVESVELTVHEQHRPRPPGASFTCSDPALDHIYEIGLRTVDLCAHDAYLDCPTRERRAWTGDAVVHQMVDLAANPDWSLARRHPVLAAAPRPDGMLPMCAASDFAANDRSYIPDWALHWVRSVHNLYRWTGDRDLVAELLGVAEGVLRWFVPFRHADGLLHDVPGWVLVDWSSVYTSGTSSALNALWARALHDFAEMSEWLDDRGRAAWARRCFAEVARGFEVFWDEARGVYVDHLVDGVPRRPAAQHGGAAALAARVVPAGRRARVVERLIDRSHLIRRSWAMDTMTPDGDRSGTIGLIAPRPAPDWDAEREMVEAQPFFRYVLHDGIAAAGRADLVAARCRDWQVFVDAGETSWPECWKGGTHCHGWSSTPTRDLVWYTLGVTPAEPGFAAVRVAPRLGDLEWAEGRVPTPHGFVTVRAERDHVEIDAPVPVVLDLGGGAPPHHLPPGTHHMRR